MGSGGSGLASAIFASEAHHDVAILSKVHPLQSHTIAAQGGINASLGNITKDDWRWHAYDTIKSSAWIADQDSVEEMCKRAPELIKMLDELGVEFDRNANGAIDQKIYGGQSTNFGSGELAYRACYSKDRTGHTIMQCLYNESTKRKVKFYNYHFALDLLIKDNQCFGISCLDMESGILRLIYAKNIIIASGGYSQIFSTATSASICTGDGNGLIARANLPLQDMEFVQFHPTALSKIGVLITEASRSAGGILLNCKGERFMQRYAPKFKELAPRDIVARAIATEILEGRGCGNNKDYIHLDLTHLSVEEIKTKLPTIYENCHSFASLDPSKELIPIAPASHYTMGGIPTNNKCQVIDFKNNSDIVIKGLYAIGEAACTSVHGAGRLGCNSLLDLVVFAKKSVESLEFESNTFTEFNPDIIKDRIERIYQGKLIDLKELKRSMQNIMSKYVGVFRTEQGLLSALEEMEKIQKEFSVASISDKNLIWNIELQNYLEIENMIVSSLATIKGALWRQESRGSHWREDYPQSSDAFLVHSLIFHKKNDTITPRKVRLTKQNVDFYHPKPRNY